jgi:hypothetical protein
MHKYKFYLVNRKEPMFQYADKTRQKVKVLEFILKEQVVASVQVEQLQAWFIDDE